MSDSKSHPGSIPVDADEVLRAPALEWVDVDSRTWTIQLLLDQIVFQSGADTIDLAQQNWSKDIYAAKHGEGFIIRVETFDCAVQFFVSAEQAAPFFSHVNPAPTAPKEPPEPQSDSKGTKPLLWPKISPLAVWALICSVLTFIPLVGWIPAMATIVLLILHRKRIRHASAWRHSRALCRYALVFLVLGVGISVLATWGLTRTDATVETYVIDSTNQESGANYGLIAGALFVVLLSLTVHEAAHATTAWWLGDSLAHSQGRVTLNPLAHIDPFGTILLPLLLYHFGGLVFGYARPVQVRVESLPRYRRAHILISLAGPGSNLILAALSIALLIAIGCVIRLTLPEASLMHLSEFDIRTSVSASGFALAPAVGAFCTILKLSFFVNTLLAMFNLIPIPPLDGSWVLEHLFPSHLGRFYALIRPYGFLIFVAAIYSNLLQYLWYPVEFILVPSFVLLHITTGF